MDKAELLSEFQSRVDQFEKFQGFIDKAKSQAGKFAPAVVEKVIQDNEQKCMQVVGEIIPLMADMERVLGELQTEREQVIAGSRDSSFILEELELRHAIGDLSDEAFEAEAAEAKGIVSGAEKRVSEIDAVLQGFKETMARWQQLGTSAGVLNPASEVELEPEEDDDDDDDLGDVAIELDLEGFEDDDSEVGHVEKVSIPEDVSPVFEGDVPSDDGFDVGDLDILEAGDEDDAAGELELEADDADDGEQDVLRRAVLLCQEGSPQEQIYPFTGEILSLGRGRDNDVQVKNDSKVSRYHCKLYRRGPNFYIEDNKSANGTLVNGELVTERRLFGGEEVLIGETYFRFRILD